MPRIGRPPGSVNRILKHDLSKLRTLFADRLGDRPPGTLDRIHVDRVFAELLGEPLPRRRRNGHTNGHTNGHALAALAIDHKQLRKQLRALDGAQLEAAALEALETVHRALMVVAARFDQGVSSS